MITADRLREIETTPREAYITKVVAKELADAYRYQQTGMNVTKDSIKQQTFIAVQKVWQQVSANYDAVERIRTLAITPETTVGEVMRWASASNVLGKGDVTLTEQDGNA